MKLSRGSRQNVSQFCFILLCSLPSDFCTGKVHKKMMFGNDPLLALGQLVQTQISCLLDEQSQGFHCLQFGLLNLLEALLYRPRHEKTGSLHM